MVEKKTVDLLVSGGKATGGPPLGPALGPLGVNVVAIVNRINEITHEYAGMKVPVKVVVDPDTKEFDVTVGTPTTSALIVSELKITKGSGAPNTEKVGDLTMEQVVRIAKLKHHELLAKTLTEAVKEILGTCVSIGVTVEGRDPREMQHEIDEDAFTDLLSRMAE